MATEKRIFFFLIKGKYQKSKPMKRKKKTKQEPKKLVTDKSLIESANAMFSVFQRFNFFSLHFFYFLDANKTDTKIIHSHIIFQLHKK